MDEESEYDQELRELQIQLVKLLEHIRAAGERVIVIFEGRDTAGKGGAIFRFTRYLNPKATQIVALPPPSDTERGQWYFQRYLRRLPNAGEISFWDRSWYNRAVVEPVMGFCTPEEHERFLHQVPEVERLLVEDGLHLIKFWFSIDADEQRRRLTARASDELKKWKLSTVDAIAQQRWDDFTRYKDEMYRRTHTEWAPWIIVRGNDKRSARLESMRYLLGRFEYAGKADAPLRLEHDPAIVDEHRPTAP